MVLKFSTSTRNIETVVAEITINHDTTKFSEAELKKAINTLNIKYPDIVYKQAIIESASINGQRWKNPKFVYGNNMFGMKVAKLRPRTNIDFDENGYCIYENWYMSLVDYGYWQLQHQHKIKTESEYLELLDNYYCNNTGKDFKYSELLSKIKIR